MHDDLRRRALESGKTTSNKAKSKHSSRGSSRGNSAANSRAASRVQSREVSDDEDLDKGNLSDDTTQSINSIDALLESDDINEQTTDIIREELRDAMNDILERKGSSTKSREESLTTYVRCLTSHYLAEVLYGRAEELLTAFMRIVKADTSDKESILALRAIALTAITYENSNLYDSVASFLKRTIHDIQSLPVKAAAIYSLGICISFGGAGEEEIMDVMTFLLEVVSSDGAFIDASDNAEVVTAALHTWGFLATQVEDLEHESEDSIAAFLEQLEANDSKVQVAVGENIALLYEKSYTPREDDEDTSSEEDGTPEDELPGDSVKGHLIKRYNPYHNKNEVLDKVSKLSSLSSKQISRRDKRSIHQSFASVAMTVEDPRVGLQSSNASKLVVRIHREGEMRVDKWWKLLRLNAIRRLLAGGFVNHYFEGNKQVLDALPMIMRGIGSAGMTSPRKGVANVSGKGKYRDIRRFVSGDFDTGSDGSKHF